jgi:hypothetical protein
VPDSALTRQPGTLRISATAEPGFALSIVRL